MNKVKIFFCEIFQLILNIIAILFGILKSILLLVPDLSKTINDQLLKVLSEIPMINIKIVIYLFIVAIATVNIICFVQNKKKEIAMLPFVKLKSCSADNVNKKANWYGANSLIAGGLNHDRYLLYLDVINDPKIKIQNNAIHVSIKLEYYDCDGNSIDVSYYGRWIEHQETILGINHKYTDIESDGESAKRLGLGYVDRKGGETLYLLDSDIVDLSSNGIIFGKIPCLGKGKYIVVAKIFGENLYDVPPIILELTNREGCRPDLFRLTNEKKWLRLIKKKQYKAKFPL